MRWSELYFRAWKFTKSALEPYTSHDIEGERLVLDQKIGKFGKGVVSSLVSEAELK